MGSISALAASESGILAHFKKTIEIDDPRFGTDWKPEDFNKRAENAKQFVKNAFSSQAFKNPTVDMLEQEIRDCYKVLDSPKKLKEALPGMKEAIESLIGKDLASKISPIQDTYFSVMSDSTRLIVLATFGLYLSPHYTQSRYLDENVSIQYDEKLVSRAKTQRNCKHTQTMRTEALFYSDWLA